VRWCRTPDVAMNELASTELETLLQDDELIVSRNSVDRVLLLRPAAGSLEVAAGLEHFYALRGELDGAWALRPSALRHAQGLPVLITDDPGGQPLATLLGAPLELPVFLRWAIGIASALAGLHGRGLIHRDLKPASILVQPATGAAWLAGLGRASRAQRQRQAPEPPHVIAGTLAYMAPEQTGRMNRSIDSRSDLYAFGVVLYQMLVGELPFTASDPMELVHCHVARRAVPPHERSSRVPEAISALVMKLLAKVAEERYQTAAGVAADLRGCLSQWQEQKGVTTFRLGTHDASDRFLIPEQLYGRQREIAALLSAFDHVVLSGRPGLTLISGYSGVGKSSVVNELHRALLPPRGLFASGKFDQYKRDIPYATLAQAFQRLVSMILVEPEAVLARYREAILGAVEPHGQLVINLVPELERVIGKQPAPPELSPQDAPRVFEQVLRRFIGVFARPEHPLALFLDDLQWLDAATLDLLEHLLVQDEVRCLFLVGAYRDNEVGPEHPLARRLQAIRSAGAPVSEIVLGPLALSDVHTLIADTLHDSEVSGLAELVYDKTAGNPFFTIQFLTALADDDLIAFDPDARRWTWDGARIASRGFTDNVVALMIEKITRLPAECREALQVMACLGNTARVEALATALRHDPPALDLAIADALNAGLVARQGSAYTFLHDRVQEAAYSSIAAADRTGMHLSIGRRLLAAARPDRLDESAFEIVGQLNRGSELVSDRAERDTIVELNLRAARRAKAATAYATAIPFLETGAALLGDVGWQRRRALSFALAYERGECEFLTGDLEQAEARLSALVEHADGLVELASLTCLRIMLHVTRSEPDRSVAVCLEYLERAGIHLEPHPSRADVEAELARVWQALGERSIEDLAQLPQTTDAATLATLEVLAAAASPAWFFDQLLPALLAAHIVNLSIAHGNGPPSCFGYTMLATKLGPFSGDYRTGYRFGKLGVALAERSASPRALARVLFTYTMFVKPWADTLDGCDELLRRGVEAAERAGDLTYATYLQVNFGTLKLLAGSPLDEAEASCRHALEYAKKLNFAFAAIALEGNLALTRTLQGHTLRFGSFDSNELDQRAFESAYGQIPALAMPMFWYWTRRQQALFLAGDATGSVRAAEAAEPLLWVADVYTEFAEHHFYGALARAECLDTADDLTRAVLRARLDVNVKALATFGDSSPITFGARARLCAAELARVEGREREAMDLYELAIRAARAARFAHIEALAFELAARFYATRGFDTIALSYRQEARAGYQRWGAHGKVRQLEQLFPEVRERPPASGTINAPVELLDLTTVIKISQAVSGETVLPRLLDTLLRTAIQHAGATRGLLIVPWQDELRVEAEASAAGGTVTVRLHGEAGGASTDLPESIVRYVLRSGSSTIIADATRDNPFATDHYIASRRARAVACFPLLNQAGVTGVLYLENELAPQTFTSTRVAVLKLISSQAAISLENTRLYANLEEREAKIRRLVEANVIGIFIWNLDGTIHDANDAFLGMIGCEREALSAGPLSWAALVPPEWQARVERALSELRATGTVQPYELECFRRDGSRLPILVGAAAFAGETGDGVAFVLDLRQQKLAERRADEAHERLRQAQADLAHVTRVTTMGELAASLAHEIKQPLTGASMNATTCARSLAAEAPNLDVSRLAASRISRDLKRAIDIVARIESLFKKQVLPHEPVDLSETIRETLAILGSEATRHSVLIAHRLAPELPRVMADRVQLQQVILNLIVNAIEAMKEIEGPREVSVATRVDDDLVRVAISDTGKGIPEQDATKIFDAFFTTKREGTGMGLAISRSIIESHGGQLSARNNSDHGATFEFALPVAARARPLAGDPP
jgi:PAS domain S-box-containing protein